MLTTAEIIDFARSLRREGVTKFVSNELELELLPPGPTPLTEIAERIGELSPEERLKIAKQAKDDLDKDLYGAVR